MIVSERLGQVVVRALAQRVHGGLHAGVRGQDDPHHLGIEIANPAQQIEAVTAVPEVQIEHRHVDLLLFENRQRHFGGVRLDYLVAVAAQQLRDDRAHQLFVLPPAGPGRVRRWKPARIAQCSSGGGQGNRVLCGFIGGQRNLNRGPFSDLTVDADGAAVGEHYALAQREPQTGARAGRFGGEERIEYALEVFAAGCQSRCR